MLASLLTLWLLHIVVVVSPGAAVLLTTHLAARNGRQAASYGALGIASGAGLWALAAVLGLGGLLLRWPGLRVGLQLAGAAYLLYVGVGMWRAAPRPREAPVHAGAAHAFRTGLLTNLSNPKAALFFASMFSSTLPAHPPAALVAVAIILVSLNSLCWHLVLAYVFSRPGSRQRSEGTGRLASRLAGGVLIAVALGLLAAALR